MDESLHELEAELQTLKPRQLNSSLLNRVGAQLAPHTEAGRAIQTKEWNATTKNRFMRWLWLSVGTAGLATIVAVVIMVVRQPGNRTGNVSASSEGIAKKADRLASEDAYKPFAASNVLYEMKDEGPATVGGDSADRRVRYRYVDTYTWKNPRNNASLTWSVPRDEIRVQPAQFN